jgi:hypothetical protein
MIFPHGLSLYNWALLLYLPSALLGFWYDWKFRGAPFRVFIPGIAGGIGIVYYVFSSLPQLMLFYLAQTIVLSSIGILIYMLGLGGNDDMIWMITLALTSFGAPFIFVGGAIILVMHKIYRSIYHLHDNPYANRYPRFYPYPMVAYMATALVVYIVAAFVFLYFGWILSVAPVP